MECNSIITPINELKSPDNKMKKILALLVFITSVAQAQFTIRGTMTPPEKSDWVILYKIEGAKQKFISNSTIKKETVNIGGQPQTIGRFELQLPETAKKGAYRVTYRDRGAGFVDFLFNKENVEFVFNPEYPDQSIVFTKSLENKVYREYLEALTLSQSKIDGIQVNYLKHKDKKYKKDFKTATAALEDVQDIYETKSKGMLANAFIKSSKSGSSSEIAENAQDYLNAVVGNFFTNVDFNSNDLYNSSFLIDKITDYVFLLNTSEDQELQQKLYKESINKVMTNVGSNDKLKKSVSEFLIERFTNARNSGVVDMVFKDYYSKLPIAMQDGKFKAEKLALLRASVGRTAPDFSWKEKNKNVSLSSLNDGETYLLIFWSTGCSHCLEEVPQLYKYMVSQPTTSVIAFGIEHDELDWNEYVKKLYGWHNVMGTHPDNKWDNETVRTYQLVATPSYFILDKNKKIIAMPNNFKDIKDYFNKK